MARILCLLLLCVCCYAGCSRIPAVSVSDDPEFHERTYSIKQGDRKVAWTVHPRGVNKDIITHRAEWTGPLQEAVPWMKKILGRILQDYNKQDFHTLMIGRLMYCYGMDNNEISERLMVAVKKSARWDTKKGRLLPGHEAVSISELCNVYDVHKELNEVFSAYGMKMKMSWEEKTLIDTVKNMPDSVEILKRNPSLDADDRLPFDCMTWFSLSSE